jgi:ABC-type nickel/cobalt efflux system permease component RcnA
MTSILLLGLLIGMKHALETDHVAAVAALASRSGTIGQAVRQGVAWGLGHTATLFAVGLAVLLIGTVVPTSIARILELAVGIMLVLLGADVIRRVLRDRLHYHAHRHDLSVHLHLHSHRGEGEHARSAHAHEHRAGLPLRAIIVGMIHGMAGSAALVLLVLATVESVWLGLLYMLLFAIGSILGMAALSCAIAVPLKLTARRLTWAYNGMTAAVGLVTILVGGAMIAGYVAG